MHEKKGLKILTPKQMLQKLSIALVQGKSGITSKNLLNQIRYLNLFFMGFFMCIRFMGKGEKLPQVKT